MCYRLKSKTYCSSITSATLAFRVQTCSGAQCRRCALTGCYSKRARNLTRFFEIEDSVRDLAPFFLRERQKSISRYEATFAVRRTFVYVSIFCRAVLPTTNFSLSDDCHMKFPVCNCEIVSACSVVKPACSSLLVRLRCIVSSNSRKLSWPRATSPGWAPPAARIVSAS